MMQAIEVIQDANGEPTLRLGCAAPLSPQPHEVLIKVHAAGLNRADILQRKGLYMPPKGASAILGLEVAGEVIQAGSGVSGVVVGDRVCALLEGGGYAEYVTAPYQQVLPVPQAYDYIKAAALPEALFTVWSNLFMLAGLKKGQSVLVHGGASGIGTTAIMLCKAFGIRCYTTAGSDKKCQFIKSLGADKAINYHTEDFVAVVQQETLGKGVDVVLDMVGGEYLQRNISVLKKNGMLICIGFVGGAKSQVSFAPVLMKNLTIKGTTLRSKSLKEKAKIAAQLHKKVWPLLDKGVIAPVIDSVFPLKEAQKAHDLMEKYHHTGKIILQCT